MMKFLFASHFVFCYTCCCLGQSLVVIDSLKGELAKTRDFREQMDIYYYLSEAWSESNFDSAIYYARTLYEMADKSSNDEYRVYGYRLIGAAFDYQYNYDSARYYYELGLNLAREAGDSAQIGVAYFNLGTLMLLSGKYVQALPYYQSALSFYEAKPAKEQSVWKIYNNLGIIYRRTKRYRDAITTYRKAIKILDADSNDRRLINLYINLANAYNSIKTYDSARFYFDKVLYLSEIYQDKYNSYYAYNGLGILSYETGAKEEARKYFLPVAQDVTIEDDNLKITAFGYLGAIYADRKQFDIAEKYYAEAFKFNDEERFPDQAKGFYGQLAQFYEQKQDYNQALFYFKKYNKLSDELLNNEVIDRTAEWEERFKTQEKEREIFALRLANQEAAILTTKKNTERNFFIFSTLFLLMLVGLVGYFYNERKKTSFILAEKNKIIGQALKEKELLMLEIHHRVKNNLQVISSLLNMQSHFIEDSKATSAVLESKNRVHSMSLIHQSLYQQDDITEVNIKEYFDQLISNLESSYNQDYKNIDLQANVTETAVDIDTAIPLGLIVNELVTNAFKHAFTETDTGKININFFVENENYILEVSDDGKGSADGILKRDKSLGTILIHDLSKKLKADLQIVAKNGVHARLIFPIRRNT